MVMDVLGSQDWRKRRVQLLGIDLVLETGEFVLVTEQIGLGHAKGRASARDVKLGLINLRSRLTYTWHTNGTDKPTPLPFFSMVK